MTKQELASYCASLLSIMESKEDAAIPRGQTLGREYTRAYKELREIIDREEKADEARKSEQRREGSQARTETAGGQPGGSGSAGAESWPGESG